MIKWRQTCAELRPQSSGQVGREGGWTAVSILGQLEVEGGSTLGRRGGEP